MGCTILDTTQKLQQINNEFQEGTDFLLNKKQRWVKQLQLLSNLSRGEENISSTMLWSYFNRVHSNLYDNKMQVKFIPTSDDEMKNAESLNKLASNDFQEMGMDIIGYDWLWDALAFSRGYVETLQFNKKRKIMTPVVINPLMLSYDPYFTSVQEWRYYSKWILKSKNQLEKLIEQKVIDGIKNCKEIASGADGQVWDYKVKRENARDTNPAGVDSKSQTNGIYQILEHYTYFDGKKMVVWTDKNITKILREEELKLNDDPENDGSRWPIVAKDVFREPHSTIGVSIFDLVEDKHRALNVLYNLSYIAAKDEATPIYEYIPDDVINQSQLFQRQIMQHIPVNKTGSIQPIKKNPAITNSMLQFANILKGETAEAIGTAQLSQPAQKGKKTASESAILQQIADLTSSLQSKIIAQGEQEFWSHWYWRYRTNVKSGDLKMVAIAHAGQHSFESISMEDIKTKLPPRIQVLSSKEAQYKEMVERRELAQQFPIFQQVIPPEKLGMFLKKVYFPKFQTLDMETLDSVFPKSLDEIKAEQENEMLNENKPMPVSEGEDHATHLYIHMTAKRNENSWAHILTHEVALAEEQAKQKQMAQNQQGGKPSSKDTNPDEAATPLKGATDKMGNDSKLQINK